MYLFAHLKFSLLGAYSEPCEKFKIELYAETSSQRNEDFCCSFVRVRYSWHARYLGCPLLGGFTVKSFIK